MIYADNAATTKLSDNAAKTIIELLDEYANPSQPYSFSRKAKQVLSDARTTIAKCINAEPNEIYFTSGGSEGNNWVIKNALWEFATTAKVITSEIEHHSVLRACDAIKRLGCSVEYLVPDKNGLIDADVLTRKMDSSVKLVSVMMVNNEIGTIQPVKELCAIAHKHGALFHTDAVQAIGHIKIDVKELGIDFLSASAHKFNGPKGIGFLYIKNGIDKYPLINGGSQEMGYRAGTENIPYIAGMAVALEDNIRELEDNQRKVKLLKERLVSKLKGLEFVINGDGHTIENILSLSFLHQSGEAMLHKLDLMGVIVSTGSACDSKETQISHVLKAIKISEELAEGTIRVSLSSDNSIEEIDRIAEKIKICCQI